jgi:hypothetical protein
MVDLLASRPYVASAMRLLLLLSVLLSALSGVGVSARAPGVAQAVAGRNAVEAVVTPAAQGTPARPVSSLPTLHAVAGTSVVPMLMAISQPLWASRRRE